MVIIIDIGYNQEIKDIIKQWPTTMMITILDELKILGCLDFDDIVRINEEIQIVPIPLPLAPENNYDY